MRSPESNFLEKPIAASETTVSYLGVSLEKAQNTKNAPNPESYKDYHNNEFSLLLQRDIAVSFAQGDPVLIEGGTSIGKTTTVRKMAADLGWEVHYVNLNGSTDASDLMGRYIPNPRKKTEDDPEYIFADGSVTSGLRQEEGKIKVIILDELNASSPANLIRLHEILDAIERNAEVVLSEDASEVLTVNKNKTHLIALINPPGKGFMQREALDPAQLRRWVYLKAATELPPEAFSEATDALFHNRVEEKAIPEEIYLKTNENILQPEDLADIPGMKEITQKYKEFHSAAKELVKVRKIAQDQPQPFTYDDRMEPRRVRDFICRFYKGDLNETFQAALKYYYAGKVLEKSDKDRLGELIKHVEYIGPTNTTKRKPLGAPATPESKVELTIEEASAIFENINYPEGFIGPEKIKKTFGFDVNPADIPPVPFKKELLEKSKDLKLQLILQVGRTNGAQPLSISEMFNLAEAKYAMILSPSSADIIANFYNSETPRLGWKLVSTGCPEVTKDKDYLEQLGTTLNLFKTGTDVSENDVPKEYLSAMSELEGEYNEIRELLDLGADEEVEIAAKKLKKLHINNLAREKACEVVYRLCINLANNTEAQFPKDLSLWTNSQVEDKFVTVRLIDGVPGKSLVFSHMGPSRKMPTVGMAFSTMKA